MAELINAVAPQQTLIIHTDGGSRGNPGPSAIGVAILSSSRDHLESYGEYIGETTNNQAEYRAVVSALKAAAKYEPQKIEFFLDSQLVVHQLNGLYRVKNVDLQPIYAQIKAMTSGKDVTFAHVMRKDNQMADLEVNKALDEH